LLAHGDKSEGLRHYRKALELDPGNTNTAKIVERLAAEGVS
jgi:hypothetical protein